MAMFADRFKDFLRTLSGDDARPSGPGGDDPRVAAAALLYHVSSADGTVSPQERTRLRAALAEEFGLDEGETDLVAAAGREADAEAVDLFSFTSVLMNHLDEDARVRFVELLWEVTYADGEVHELEDNLIWRISDLLGVSTRDRMLMKQRAARHSKDS
ncbi:TerB family tellurite resistance protein [Consotaella aegiceratis]|uniref:tellurite resistance TerB family protein n=1 Tax=Consotaella aegiceratis TaxID=3097961 RepID=UPI002F3F97C0